MQGRFLHDLSLITCLSYIIMLLVTESGKSFPLVL